MSKDEAFFVEEYKLLRAGIASQLKDRFDFHRWGLIGLAALYSYIFSNPGKPILFWVPVFLSLAMISHLNEEHRMIKVLAGYIKDEVEPWAKGGNQIPSGWETYLKRQPIPSLWWVWRRWQSP